MPTSIIQYTGEQARSFASITPEEWRHWRKVVPRLAAKKGKKARFTAGEIVALTAMASVIQGFDVNVGGLGTGWDELFCLCAQRPPVSLRSASIVVTASAIHLSDVGSPVRDEAAIVVPCEPIVNRLWAAAVSAEVEQVQAPLPFAPQAVGGASGS